MTWVRGPQAIVSCKAEMADFLEESIEFSALFDPRGMERCTLFCSGSQSLKYSEDGSESSSATNEQKSSGKNSPQSSI